MSERQHEIVPLPDCDPEIGRMLFMMEDARTRTRSALLGLDKALIDWRENDDTHTIGTILYHLAISELHRLSEIVDLEGHPIWEQFTESARDDHGVLSTLSAHSYEWYWQRLNHVRLLLLDAFQRMSPDDFRRPRRAGQREFTPEWMLYHLLQHEAEHRMELRLLRTRAERAS